MATTLSEDVVRGHQADRRAAAARWALARDARSARPRRNAPRTPRRARTRLAGALRAVAGRLEAGGTALP
jgi:hypothetical protein